VIHRISRLEYGALAVAALAAVYGIWLGVGLPPLPLGIHLGRSQAETPITAQVPPGPFGAVQRTLLPATPVARRTLHHAIGTALRVQATRERRIPAAPHATAMHTIRTEPSGERAQTAVPTVAVQSIPPQSEQPAQQVPPVTSPLPLPPTVTVTVPALPDAPPLPQVPQVPEVPQVPSPPPQAPALPALP
jgi:hypothetical protein